MCLLSWGLSKTLLTGSLLAHTCPSWPALHLWPLMGRYNKDRRFKFTSAQVTSSPRVALCIVPLQSVSNTWVFLGLLQRKLKL